MKEIVLAGAVRTAMGSFGGTLASTPAAQLGSIVIKEALNRAGVKPEMVDDDKMKILARDIAKKIESELDYPGQIKISVIRESRTVDYAK